MQVHTERTERGRLPSLVVDRECPRARGELRDRLERGRVDFDAGQAATGDGEPLHRCPAGRVGGGEQILALGDELAQPVALAPALAELAEGLQLLVLGAGDGHVAASGTKRAPSHGGRPFGGAGVRRCSAGSQRLTGALGKASEGIGVVHGDVGQDLAVELDVREIEAGMHNCDVRKAV